MSLIYSIILHTYIDMCICMYQTEKIHSIEIHLKNFKKAHHIAILTTLLVDAIIIPTLQLRKLKLTEANLSKISE